MANLIHETGGFHWLKENSDGKYLRGREDLGHGPDEGERWKGAGVLMLSGKLNYQAFQKWMLKREGIDDPLIVELGQVMSPRSIPSPVLFLGLKIIVSWTFVLTMVLMLAATRSTVDGTDTKNGSTSMRGAADTWCKEHASQINIRQR